MHCLDRIVNGDILRGEKLSLIMIWTKLIIIKESQYLELVNKKAHTLNLLINTKYISPKSLSNFTPTFIRSGYKVDFTINRFSLKQIKVIPKHRT